MTTSLASPRKSVNRSSHRRRIRPSKDDILDVADIVPILSQREDDFDERWAEDEECEEQPRRSGWERWKQLQLERAERRAQGLVSLADDEDDEDEDDEDEDDVDVDDYDEEEEAEVEEFFHQIALKQEREWQRRIVEQRRKYLLEAGAKPPSLDEAPASDIPHPSDQTDGFGTPSLRKWAKQEGIVLVPTAFRQITDNGDQALLLAQLTFWFDTNGGKRRANFKLHGRIWEPKTHAQWAKETGMPEHRIRRVIDGLVKLGFVEREHAKYRGAKTTILRPLPGRIARACGYERKTRSQKQ